ncbi:MAG TPA: 3-oxoadipate enol-lactonase [Casimicrobiaceae bacterium]|nr:3-oxoadipate enol-lactonase [Casimicrobiaceae bacterium]
MASSIIDVAGERFAVRVDGPAGASAVVFSNSLGANLEMWEPQMAALASRFRVVRYDTRGHGGSFVPAGDYGIDTLGRDVLGILDALAIRRAHFCGLSMGGATGMWLALHAPQRIGRLVLANTATKFGTAERWNARIDAVSKGGIAAIADGVLEIWFTAAFRAKAPERVEPLRAMLLATPVPGYLAACRAVRDVELGSAIAGVARPTLVIVGAQDGSTPPAQGRAIAQAVPRARLVELPAAHISNVEAAAAFNAELLAFLTTEER